MRRTVLLLAILSGLAGAVRPAWANLTGTVVLVSSDSTQAYAETAQTLTAELERAGLPRQQVTLLRADQVAASRVSSPTLYIALGLEAAAALSRQSPASPVLCALIPRASFEAVLAADKRRASSQFSALYLTQPFERQLALARLVFPGLRRLGVIWGPQSQDQAPTLRNLTQAQGLELIEGTVTDSAGLYPPLKSVLEQAQLLLSVPDTLVFNSNTIQNILLSALRAGVPMAGFSPGYTKAGALYSLHTTPAQVGLQAAGLAARVLGGQSLPATPVYGRDFEITVNPAVARVFGRTLDTSALKAELLRREKMP